MSLKLPKEYNYIGIFLTYACNLRCSYCLNRQSYLKSLLPMTPSYWIRALNRIEATEDMPLTLQGGEPTQYPYFYEVINEVDKPMDLLTNGVFDVDRWIKNVPVKKFYRNAPYASIRISYHPEDTALAVILKNTLRLQEAGYQVGLYMIEHPQWKHLIPSIKFQCRQRRIDFRTKEFLGVYKGKLYGTYKYPEAVNSLYQRTKQCRGSELLVAADGKTYKCHSDLYASRNPIGHILNEKGVVEYRFRECKFYGSCNSCDVKVTTDRRQVFGHTSMEIKGGCYEV